MLGDGGGNYVLNVVSFLLCYVILGTDHLIFKRGKGDIIFSGAIFFFHIKQKSTDYFFYITNLQY
jgi:hypothetical protein